jgi:hypothetical protein
MMYIYSIHMNEKGKHSNILHGITLIDPSTSLFKKKKKIFFWKKQTRDFIFFVCCVLRRHTSLSLAPPSTTPLCTQTNASLLCSVPDCVPCAAIPLSALLGRRRTSINRAQYQTGLPFPISESTIQNRVLSPPRLWSLRVFTDHAFSLFTDAILISLYLDFVCCLCSNSALLPSVRVSPSQYVWIFSQRLRHQQQKHISY